MNKDLIVMVLKIVAAVIAAILGIFGAFAFSSCSFKSSHDVVTRGFGVFHYVDTVYTVGTRSILVPKE